MSRIVLRVMLVAVALMAAGCNLPQTASPAPAATNTPIEVVPTLAAPDVTGIYVSTAQTDSEQTALGVEVAATKGPLRIKLYFVATGDNGKTGKLIGCGDSLVEVSRDIPRTGSPLTDTLNLLFSIKDQYYEQSGLYNSLHSSYLTVEGISARDGVFRVNLIGTMSLAGECDDPRFAEQIKATIMQFSTVKEAHVFINGTPMEKLLGGAGG